MKKTKLRIGIIIIILGILYISLTSGAFTSNPEINPTTTGELYTYQDLECRWTIDSSVEVNVTWYVGGIINKTYNRTCTAGVECVAEGAGGISQSLTIKDQTWTCEVAYFNGTTLEMKNHSRTIADAPPTTPRVFLGEIEVMNNSIINISEDYVSVFQINSTDPDNDTVTYTYFTGQIPSFCTLDSNTGQFTCSPTQESHIGINNVTVYASSGGGLKISGFKFYINVTQNNDAPYFNPSLINKTVNEGSSLNYNITGGDQENDLPYSFSIQSDLGSNLIIVMLNSTSASIRFNNSGLDIAQFSNRGNHTINVTINDSGNPSRSNTSSFVLEVIPTNHLANITVEVVNAESLTQGGQLTIRVNASDIDNDTLTFTTNNMELYNITYTATNKSDPNGTSFANGTIYVAALTNDHVINRNLVITVFDGKENRTNSTFLNITNTNDNPVLNEISTHASNTLSNTNISNLTAYTGVVFRYVVNGTDIDQLTYAGDTLIYASNDSNFEINSTTGMINFTKNEVGTYYVKINVTDSGQLYDEAVAIINIYTNQNPYFNSTLVLGCAEYDQYNYPFNCTINISDYSKDDDIGDNVTSYWTNSTLFTINETTGLINFRANQTIIGNYSVMVNITDSRGGMNSTIMQLTINNTNNRPVILDISEPVGRLSVQESYNYGISTNDSDIYLTDSYENLTFNYTVTGPNSSIITIQKTSDTEAVMIVNPTTSQHAGNYTVTVRVTDYYNNQTTDTVTFYIYNVTTPPNITQIRPYGTPLLSGSVNTSWINVSDLGRSNTTITITENTTYLFNHTTTYDTSYENSLSYEWYQNGTLVGTSYDLNISFDFFSAGIHNITLIVTDEFNKNTTFLWIVNVTNINRRPVLINQLTNLTGVNAVNGTTTFSNYMTYYSSEAKFYDPDDDIDGDNVVEDTESTMTFTASSCTHASFSFINNSLRVQTLSVGTCIVNFTAYDSLNNSLTANSSGVLINITYVSNETITEEVPTTTSGGGGGGGRRTVTIPIPEEVEKPKPLEIITPKLVTIYKNATVTVPIILNNTWNDTLEGVTVRADTNASNVSIYLDRTYFPRLFRNQTEEVTLTISNYKSEGHYEIQVRANVLEPDFTDTATIYVNSADTTSEGEELETKISFARDLLSSNPECQELTELLNEAKKQLAVNNYEGTAKLVDSVINGCKYLVSSSSQIEKPSKEVSKRFVWKSAYNEYAIITGFTILFIIALYYIIKKDKDQNA